MPFIPLQSGSPASFPRVRPDEQAERDESARQLVATEIEDSSDDPPEVQQVLRREYELRFGGHPPMSAQRGSANAGEQVRTSARRGFIPLVEAGELGTGKPKRGFIPIEDDKPSVLRNVALNNPLTAIGETALNLASQSVAMPLAGLAGLATEAGRAMGMTDKTGADVVHSVGNAMTYQPRGEMGQAATALVMTPFEKLAELGQAAGGKVLDATG
ncbi:MAG: hypothetical protein ACD_10C00691G0002, partial [uncultured bacterium]